MLGAGPPRSREHVHTQRRSSEGASPCIATPFVALLAAAAAATSSFGAVSRGTAPESTPTSDPDVAVHGSDTLVLADDWGTAAACIELGDVTECFDTEADLLAAHEDVLGGGSRRSVGGGANAAAAGQFVLVVAAALQRHFVRRRDPVPDHARHDPQPRRLRVRQRHVELPGRWLSRRVVQPRRPRWRGLSRVHRPMGPVPDDGRRMEQRRLQRLHLLTPAGDHGAEREEADQQRGWCGRDCSCRCRS